MATTAAVASAIKAEQRGDTETAAAREGEAIAGILMLLLSRGRLRARRAGASSLRDEVSDLRRAGYDLRHDPRAVGLSHLDRRRAIHGAASYARGYRGAVTTALVEGKAGSEARAAALRAREWHLRTLVATESAQAFNAERAAQAAELSFLGPEFVPARQWVAELDACPSCWDLDGSLTGINDTFDGDEPGAVHPNCRCYDAIVMVAPSEIGFAA